MPLDPDTGAAGHWLQRTTRLPLRTGSEGIFHPSIQEENPSIKTFFAPLMNIIGVIHWAKQMFLDPGLVKLADGTGGLEAPCGGPLTQTKVALKLRSLPTDNKVFTAIPVLPSTTSREPKATVDFAVLKFGYYEYSCRKIFQMTDTILSCQMHCFCDKKTAL